jgi:ATP phosphoribosyltransferase
MPKIALPNKGRLSEEVRALLRDAGLDVRLHDERALVAELGEDFSAIFVRAQDIPEFVADGAADAGITGRDCVAETGSPLEERLDLGLGRCRLAIAGPARLGGTVADLPEGLRVATSFPTLTATFFAKASKRVEIVRVSGAAEVTPHLGIADAIVDLVSTGSTLRVNGLHEIATILNSSAVLVARPSSNLAPEIDRALGELSMALGSVLRARGKRYLMANVPRVALASVRDILPGLNGPTIVDGNSGDYVAVHAVVDASAVYRTTVRLKSVGCEGILVTRIERMVP